jgi:quinone-modifying oxidoreductase, subunit QmoC
MEYHCDPTLLAEVRRFGKFDVAGCFNCGSCVLSCDLAGDHAAFPRRSTRQVLMGLSKLLRESLDPWICHDCGDCAIVCPRQTEPRKSMETLRRYLASVYDWTGIAAKINSSRAWHLGTLALVGVLVLALVVFYHVYTVKMPFNEFASTPMGLEHMFPLMSYLTTAVILFPLLMLMVNAFRMYLFTVHRKEIIKTPLSQWLIDIKIFVLHFFTYKKMMECPTGTVRWYKHMFLASGCLVMLILLVFWAKWFQTDKIYPLLHPQRWIGYIATAFLIFGTIDILIGRLKKEKEIHKTSDFLDWTFPILLLATTVSGIAVHILRVSGLELATHYVYALHLIISVPMLVIEMPFGKWTHMIYRPLALYFLSLREKTLEQQVSSEEVPEYVAS